MRRLCANLRADVIYHDAELAGGRRVAAREISNILKSRHWDLVYLEGTGIVGGLPLLRAAWKDAQRFVISSGDPVGGFFRVTRGSLLGKLFEVYERRLYRACSAFVGWTPYLTGMALQMGACRAVTVEGGVNLNRFRILPNDEKAACRTRFGLPSDHLVCTVVGSLNWSSRAKYCYGLELVETLRRLQRSDISMLIVGDGTGRERLQRLVPASLAERVVFTGRLPEDEVVGAMNAADIGFVTQSLDGLGNYRLTTKLPEYLACGLPIAMSPIPGFYDYVREAGWALPPFHPASTDFHAGCASWLDRLSREEIAAKSIHARPMAEDRFDDERLSAKFCAFVEDLLCEPQATT